MGDEIREGLCHSPLFGLVREYFVRHDSGDEVLFLFVPYIKTDVLEDLLDGIKSRIVIVTTWKPGDLQQGSSELKLYPFCRERGISLYVENDLHLKLYSAGLKDAILATGNVSRRGLLGGNHELAAAIRLTARDRLYLEGIRSNARLMDDGMYGELGDWLEDNKVLAPEPVTLEDVVSVPGGDDFLISALPMTHSVDALISGYERIASGREPSDDPETSSCIYHDLTNYGIRPGLSGEGLVGELSSKFFGHPFIKRIDEFISPEAYFGRIKEWIQNNCTDVPIPSRRELTGNVQVLLEWFVELGGGKYLVDIPGARSQRIRRISNNT